MNKDKFEKFLKSDKEIVVSIEDKVYRKVELKTNEGIVLSSAFAETPKEAIAQAYVKLQSQLFEKCKEKLLKVENEAEREELERAMEYCKNWSF